MSEENLGIRIDTVTFQQHFLDSDTQNVPLPTKNKKVKRKYIRRDNKQQKFDCEICAKSFSHQSSLSNHRRQHKSDAPFVCQYCKKSFYKSPDLRRHLKCHEGDCKFNCEKCDVAFATSRALLSHNLAYHKGDSALKCNFCEKTFNYKRKLKVHIRTDHPNEYLEMQAENSGGSKPKSFPCHVCYKRLVSSAKLKIHLAKMHTDKSRLLCDICAEPLYSVNSLKRHKLRKHGVKLTFDCRYCFPKSVFDSQIAFKHHLKTRHSAFRNAKGHLQCQVCHKIFSKMQTLRDHVSAVHFGQKKQSNESDSAMENEEVVGQEEIGGENASGDENSSGDENINFDDENTNCDDENTNCDENTNFGEENVVSGENTNFGAKNVSGNENNLMTPVDTASSANISNFVSEPYDDSGNFFENALHQFNLDHLAPDSKSTDSSDCLFTCELCGRAFKHRQSLRNHKLSKHAGLGPFPCEFCTRVFREKRTMQFHMKTKHPDMKTSGYPCDVCNKSFASSAKLKDHLTLHSDECQFLCDFCAEPFRTAETLKRHKVRTHGVKLTFNCRYCRPTATFENRVAFKQHVKSVHTSFRNQKGQLECQICQKTFLRTRGLRDHVAGVHFGEKRYTCNVCGRKFAQYPALHQHKLTHSDFRSYICTICEKGFKTNASFYIHKRFVHGEKTPAACSVCNKMFSSATNMARHKRTHFNQRKYSCEKCNKSYKKSQSLKRHCRQFHSNEILSCEQCEKTFESEKLFQRHVRLHTGDAPFQCPKCELTYTEQKSLDRHLQSHEENPTTEPTFDCEVCHSKYSKRDSLLSHYRRNHREYYNENVRNKTNYKCEKCNEQFPLKMALYLHIKTNHEEYYNEIESRLSPDREHKCELCGLAYKELRTLHRHYESHYEETRPATILKCEVCQSEYTKHDSLRKHYLRNHRAYYDQNVRNKVQFKCEHCNEEFSNKTQLYSHIKNNHESNESETTDLPFSCNECNLGYKDKRALRRHIQTHVSTPLEENEMNCHYCDVKYTQKASLQRHMLRHHKEHCPKKRERKFVECEYCYQQFFKRTDVYTHVKHIHIDNYNDLQFKCDSCDFAHKDQISWRSHQRIVHGVILEKQTLSVSEMLEAKKLFKCEVCNDFISNRNDLYSHVRSVHVDYYNDMPYKCEFSDCDFAHKERIVWLSHHRRVHGTKPQNAPQNLVNCNLCGRQFSENKVLYTHLKQAHVDYYNELSHKCKYKNCDFADKTKLGLLSHNNKIHLKQSSKKQLSKKSKRGRPAKKVTEEFLCNICDFSTTTKVQLTKHLKTHRTNKPTENVFECPKCNETFTQMSQLNRHQKIHREEEKIYNNSVPEITPILIKEEPMDISNYEMQEADPNNFESDEEQNEITHEVQFEVVDPELCEDIPQSLDLFDENDDELSEIECEVSLNEGDDVLNFQLYMNHDSDNENVESVLS